MWRAIDAVDPDTAMPLPSIRGRNGNQQPMRFEQCGEIVIEMLKLS